MQTSLSGGNSTKIFNTIVNIPRSASAASPKYGHTGFHTYQRCVTTDDVMLNQTKTQRTQRQRMTHVLADDARTSPLTHVEVVMWQDPSTDVSPNCEEPGQRNCGGEKAHVGNVVVAGSKSTQLHTGTV
jgi:hypothetical protein